MESKGNIAFNKNINPKNFLDSKLSLNLFHWGGGVSVMDTTVSLLELSDLRKNMAIKYKTSEEIINSEEWEKFNNVFSMKNSWIIKYDLNAGLESNQDFSKRQNTLGLRLGASIKSWNNNSTLTKINILYYPFALIRTITGYDKSFQVSGATLPGLLIGFDYVNPVKDTLRKSFDEDLKPFPRINFEIGFRTEITRVVTQTIFFNCSFKYFAELGAPHEIKENSLDKFTYFTSSLSSNSGFFVSYSYGKLPFDRVNDAVYEIGFRYKFK